MQNHGRLAKTESNRGAVRGGGPGAQGNRRMPGDGDRGLKVAGLGDMGVYRGL